MQKYNEQVLPATNITLTPISLVVDSQHLNYISAQVITTGSSPTGTVKLQFSDYPDGQKGPIPSAQWSDSGASLAVSSAATLVFPLTQICYRWIRFTWTQTSGTGTVAINANAQGPS